MFVWKILPCNDVSIHFWSNLRKGKASQIVSTSRQSRYCQVIARICQESGGREKPEELGTLSGFKWLLPWKRTAVPWDFQWLVQMYFRLNWSLFSGTLVSFRVCWGGRVDSLTIVIDMRYWKVLGYRRLHQEFLMIQWECRGMAKYDRTLTCYFHASLVVFCLFVWFSMKLAVDMPCGIK